LTGWYNEGDYTGYTTYDVEYSWDEGEDFEYAFKFLTEEEIQRSDENHVW